MYIYQTDCYLIYDQLEEWCNKGYDYIGAPILATDAQWKNYKNKDKFEPQVGNGGFSLRKISTFKELTNPKGEFREYYKLTDELLSKVIYEDKYFANDIYNFYDLTRPTWPEALFFALDMNVDVIYNNGFKGMPMGIHAWGKNIRHWKNILEELKDNQEVIDYCENAYKEYFDIYYNKPNNDNIKDIFRMYICAYNGYGKEYIPNEDYYEYVDYKNCDNKFNDTKLLYSEYYQIYDILTNRDLLDYIGICHYRRYLKFDLNDIEKLDNKEYDIILPKPYRFGIDNYSQFTYNFDPYFLDVIRNILEEYYPDYLESYEYFLKDEKIYTNSIMITNKDIFINYCNFIFDIFDKFLKYMNIKNIKDIQNYIDINSDKFKIKGIKLSDMKMNNYDEYISIRKNFSRICGFLGERLLNVYVMKNNLRILEKDMIIYNYEK